MYGKRDKEKEKKNVKWRKWGSSAIIQSVWSKSYGLHDFQYIYIMHDATYNVSQVCLVVEFEFEFIYQTDPNSLF